MAGDLELMQGGLAAYTEKGPQAVMDHWLEQDAVAPDFRAIVQSDIPNGGVWEGVDGYARMTDQWLDAWDSFGIEAHEYIELTPHHWVVPITVTGSVGSGPEVSAPFIYTFVFEDGRLREYGIWTDRAQAEASLGD